MTDQYQRLFYGLLSLSTITKGPEQFKSNIKNFKKCDLFIYITIEKQDSDSWLNNKADLPGPL